MPGPFDYLNSINDNKEDIMDDESSYSPFMVNRGLSYFPDTLFYANEMNRFWQADHRLQYDFLRHSIRKRKRFSKWFKEAKEPDILAIKEYFGYNDRNARFAMKILSKEQIREIKQKIKKGGTR